VNNESSATWPPVSPSPALATIPTSAVAIGNHDVYQVEKPGVAAGTAFVKEMKLERTWYDRVIGDFHLFVLDSLTGFKEPEQLLWFQKAAESSKAKHRFAIFHHPPFLAAPAHSRTPPPRLRMAGRVFNFSAGPAALPLPVLERAAAEGRVDTSSSEAPAPAPTPTPAPTGPVVLLLLTGSIAWLYREDYENSGVRMLPVVEQDGRSTARQILLYSIGLIPISLLPAFLGMSGKIYFVGALLMSLALLYFGIRLATFKMAPNTARSKQRARQLLQATVIYLPILFALMMLNTVSS
jgi:hypothetical protein